MKTNQEITIYTISYKLIKVIVLEKITSARKLMEKENVDALIVKQPHNLYYMTGWTPKVTARPILAVVPLENETTLIIPEIEETTSRRYADQIKKIITYSENKYNLFEASARTLKKVIEDMSLTKGRIGIEEDFLPVHYYRFLKNNLPEIELVDADSLIWRLRMIKTTISTKGQVVIPSGIRRRHGWDPGTALELEELEDGVVLRQADSLLQQQRQHLPPRLF